MCIRDSTHTHIHTYTLPPSMAAKHSARSFLRSGREFHGSAKKRRVEPNRLPLGDFRSGPERLRIVRCLSSLFPRVSPVISIVCQYICDCDRCGNLWTWEQVRLIVKVLHRKWFRVPYGLSLVCKILDFLGFPKFSFKQDNEEKGGLQLSFR